MAWETRGEKRYYYRARRHGKRVVKEYFGCGKRALSAASRDDWKRHVRTVTATRIEQLRNEIAAAKVLDNDGRTDFEMKLQAHMQEHGYHYHRGESAMTLSEQQVPESLEHSQLNEPLRSLDPLHQMASPPPANAMQRTENQEQFGSDADASASLTPTPQSAENPPKTRTSGTLFINALNSWLYSFSRSREAVSPQLIEEAKQRLKRLVSEDDSELIWMAGERAVMLQVKLEVLDYVLVRSVLRDGGEMREMMKYQADLAKQYARALKEFAVLKKLSWEDTRIRLQKTTTETAEICIAKKGVVA